jgi:hypothetical protein
MTADEIESQYIVVGRTRRGIRAPTDSSQAKYMSFILLASVIGALSFSMTYARLSAGIVFSYSTSAGAQANTPSGTGLRSLQPTLDNISMAIVSDHHVGNATDKNIEAGNAAYVWAAFSGHWPPQSVPVPGVFESFYFNRLDGYTGGSTPYIQNTYPVSWFLTNHPEWVMYKRNRSSVASDSGVGVQLNEQNQNVQNWQFQTIFKPAIQSDYNGISFDNGSARSNGAAGIYQSVGVLSTTVEAGATEIEVSRPIALGTNNAYIAIGNASDREYEEVLSETGTGPYIIALARPLNNSHLPGEWVGQWKLLYSGSQVDPRYISTTVNAYASLTGRIKAYATSIGKPNFLITLNDPLYYPSPVVSYAMIKDADIILEESGFTNYGHCLDGTKVAPNPCSGSTDYLTNDGEQGADGTEAWLRMVQYFQYLNQQGKGFVIVDNFPYTRDSASAVATYSDMEWALANYLLVKGNHSYQGYLNAYGYMNLKLAPYYKMQIGHPTTQMYEKYGVYYRNYSNGLAIVNPSAVNTFTVRVPSGMRDLNGNAVPTSYTMPVHSGLILLNGRPDHSWLRSVILDYKIHFILYGGIIFAVIVIGSIAYLKRGSTRPAVGDVL